MHYVEQIHCENILTAALDFAEVYAKLNVRGERGAKWKTADLYLDGIRLLEIMLLWAAGQEGQQLFDIRWMEDLRKGYAIRRAALLGKIVGEIDDFLPPEQVQKAISGLDGQRVYYYGIENRR